MTSDPVTDQAACSTGWYYDPLHRQPVYLFWREAAWWGRFVWQEMLQDAGDRYETVVSAQDSLLTSDMYERLIPLSNYGKEDYISRGGCAIRDVYGMRPSVQVKLRFDGRGVYIQAPALDNRGQHEPGCDVVWLTDDEIPTIIRALQARRRAVLDPDFPMNEADNEE